MSNQHSSTTDNHRRIRIGIIACISLGVLVVIFTFVPRFLVKGPYQKPHTTGDGWVSASLSEVGMDKKPILDLLRLLAQQEEPIVHSVLIVKDGKLVLETYYPGEDIAVADNKQFFTKKDFDRDTLHCMASASKSVTSILFGIAYDQGKITNLDEKMFTSFPEYAELSDESKAEITLRQMLTMTSGIPWQESPDFNDPTNDLARMAFFSPDPVRFVLEKKPNSRPGELFQYNSGTTNLLGEILKRKTGTSLNEFAKDNLFNPLGITSFEWATFPASPNMTVASSLLYLKPRDMAKIGQLYLQLGIWNGEQIISPQWVHKSTAISVQVPADYGPAFKNTGYGYQWWDGTFATGNTDTYYAAGWGGQFIFIMPKINTVVVTTGSNYYGSYSNVFNMINQYILGSIYSSN